MKPLVPHPTAVLAAPTIALIRHEWRILRQNRSACLLLVGFALAFALAGLRPPPQQTTHYILYWHDDAWVAQLRAALENDPPQARIAILPAAAFTNDAGVITYPRGSSSIQLRPPSGERQSWLVWYWYDGGDPAVLDPVVDWFWKASRARFGDSTPMEIRVSTLDSAGKRVRGGIDAVDSAANLPQLLVVSALFFCGLYLPALSLAQQQSDGTLTSLVLTKLGAAGVRRGIRYAYGVLGIALAQVALIAAIPGASIVAAIGMAVALAAYLGLAFTLASRCSSVASTTTAVAVYAGVAMLAVLGPATFGRWGEMASSVTIEGNLLACLTGDDALSSVLRLVALAMVANWLSCSGVVAGAEFGKPE